jgi:hypothetical protein
VILAPIFSARTAATSIRRGTLWHPPELFGIPVKHKLLTRDQRNVQQAPRTFDSLAGDAVDEGVTFERRAPHGRKIFSLPHQLGAFPRKIIRSLFGHRADPRTARNYAR